MYPLAFLAPALWILVSFSSTQAQTTPGPTPPPAKTTAAPHAAGNKTVQSPTRKTVLHPEFQSGIPARDFYRGLNNHLSPFYSVQRPALTQSDKAWGTFGKALGIGCLGVGIIQAIPLIEGKTTHK